MTKIMKRRVGTKRTLLHALLGPSASPGQTGQLQVHKSACPIDDEKDGRQTSTTPPHDSEMQADMLSHIHANCHVAQKFQTIPYSYIGIYLKLSAQVGSYLEPGLE